MYVSANDNWDQARHMVITVNGEPVPCCMWFDTDLGIAECVFATRTEFKTIEDGLMYMPLITQDHSILFVDRNPIEGDVEYFNYQVHSYYLHNFEVRDSRTGEIIAVVR